jgi:hypothetical protein
MPVMHVNSGESNTPLLHCLVGSGISHHLSPSTLKGYNSHGMACQVTSSVCSDDDTSVLLHYLRQPACYTLLLPLWQSRYPA